MVLQQHGIHRENLAGKTWSVIHLWASKILSSQQFMRIIHAIKKVGSTVKILEYLLYFMSTGTSLTKSLHVPSWSLLLPKGEVLGWRIEQSHFQNIKETTNYLRLSSLISFPWHLAYLAGVLEFSIRNLNISETNNNINACQYTSGS